MKYEYKKEFNTPYSSVDRSGYLGLVESMNINQDMITEFLGYLKSDNKTLRATDNAAWVYTRTKLHSAKRAFWNTKTCAKSFVSSKSAIKLDIETDLRDDSGDVVFVAKTEMCAIDFSERKLRKIDSLSFPKDLEVQESGIGRAYSKLNCEFTENDFCFETKVFASDTDFTHHTNNAHYTKYLMNTFSSDFYDTKVITDFEIQFSKETVENDIVRIYKKQTAENEFSFLIKCNEIVIVKALLKYSD